ncbi:MAG: hypothetical protein P8181_06900 [bacterium]
MKTPLIRFVLAVLVVIAANGCSDDDVTAPSSEHGAITASGTFMDVDDQSESEAKLQITFESVEQFVEVTNGDEIMRNITTGPTKIHIRGHNQFLIAAAAGLETNPVKLRYRRRSDGICDVAATMTCQTDTGDRFALNVIARYDENKWLAKPGTLDDIPAASGVMQLVGIQGDTQRRSFCEDLFVSIRGMKPLIEEFEEPPVDGQKEAVSRRGAGNAW